jgi:hypothetical protein
MVGTVHTAFRQCQHYTHQIADISRDSSRITLGAFQARTFVHSIVLTLVLVLTPSCSSTWCPVSFRLSLQNKGEVTLCKFAFGQWQWSLSF